MRSVGLHITGRVQGVGYRAWAVQTARQLGLRGWVRNLLDGSVEALAIGDDDAVAALIEACRRGPAAARVVDVAICEASDDNSEGFGARPDA
ncbi:MAG TPA: acylphosphatase [Stellaceae bacterium]|nr:acylphosphatase [Stellaceae bacterium]